MSHPASGPSGTSGLELRLDDALIVSVEDAGMALDHVRKRRSR